MGSYLFYELIIAAEYKSRDLGCRIRRDDGLNKRPAQTRKAEIEEIVMGILQITLERRDVDVIRKSFLFENLIVDHSEEGRRVHIVRFTDLCYCLLTYSHLEPKTADDLDGILFMRHQVAYFIGTLIHRSYSFNHH